MLTFLINLDTAQDRRDRMYRQLEAAHVAVERIGVDLRNCTNDAIQRWTWTHFPRVFFDLDLLSTAEAGCWASHLTAWRRLLQAPGESACAVIEDDLLLAPGFENALSILAQENALDVVYLGTSSKNISTRRRTPVGGLWLHEPIGIIFNTWGYVMTRRYAERFFSLEGILIDMPIDHFMGGRAKAVKPRIAVLRPAVVSEDPELGPHSQIQPYNSRVDRHPLWEGTRRALLSSRVSDLYYSLYRLL